MKVQIVAQFYALVAATGIIAQTPWEMGDIPHLESDGPFALRVKGQAVNSSIDGYLHTTLVQFTEDEMVLQYEPDSAPKADNSSYRFNFNYTGEVEFEGHQLGFFISDRTVGKPNYANLTGRAMSMQYRPVANVALPVLGVRLATVDYTGFDADNKAFLNYYTDDSYTVPNMPANVSFDRIYYNWAVCWQTYTATTGPFLSWIMNHDWRAP